MVDAVAVLAVALDSSLSHLVAYIAQMGECSLGWDLWGLRARQRLGTALSRVSVLRQTGWRTTKHHCRLSQGEHCYSTQRGVVAGQEVRSAEEERETVAHCGGLQREELP